MWRWLSIALVSAFLTSACSDTKEPYDDDHENHGTQPEDSLVAGVASDGKSVGIFPSDLHSVPSDDTYTGRKVKLRLASNDPLYRETHANAQILEFLDKLDGFGTTAGGWIRFTERVNSATVIDGQSVLFGYIEGDTARLVPSETPTAYRQVAVRPHLPLPPMVTGFIASTTDIQSDEGEAFGPSKELKAILDGSYDPSTGDIDEELAERMRTVAQQLVDAQHIESTDRLSALAVFTTQSIHQTSLEITEKIRAYDPAISIGDNPCETIAADQVRRCYLNITVRNFVSDDNTIADDAADRDINAENATYTLKATVHLPLVDAAERAENATGDDRFVPYDVEKGYPVAIFGHGLTGDGDQAKDIAKYISPLGIATIGVDAPQHASHPTVSHEDEGPLDLLQALFGIAIDGSKVRINPFQLRDGWRQSNLDKLGLIEAIKKGIDIDGDGHPELDADRISYLGASLGGIQGPELLALTPDLELALLAIGGARISDFLRYPGMIAAIATFIAPQVKSDGFMRLLIILQTAIEKGDGANWAPYVLQNRFPDAGEPMHIGMQFSVPDEVVPKETGIMLTRTLGVPIIGTVQLSAPLVDEVPYLGEPIRLNHASGKTAGAIQVHWIHKMNNLDEWRETSHASSPDSLESLTYWKHIFHSMYYDDSRIPELIDPYVVLGEEPPSVYVP